MAVVGGNLELKDIFEKERLLISAETIMCLHLSVVFEIIFSVTKKTVSFDLQVS